MQYRDEKVIHFGDKKMLKKMKTSMKRECCTKKVKYWRIDNTKKSIDHIFMSKMI